MELHTHHFNCIMLLLITTKIYSTYISAVKRSTKVLSAIKNSYTYFQDVYNDVEKPKLY